MIQTQESRAQDWHRERWPELLEIASREVFQLMLGSELQPFAESSAGATLDCTAMVGLAGRMCGVLTVRCQPECAVRIASRMLRLESPASEEEALDAIGEVCNMIGGNFKNKIAGLSEACVLSAPTVVVGGEYRVHCLAAHSVHKVFQFEGAPISIALELRR